MNNILDLFRTNESTKAINPLVRSRLYKGFRKQYRARMIERLMYDANIIFVITLAIVTIYWFGNFHF